MRMSLAENEDNNPKLAIFLPHHIQLDTAKRLWTKLFSISTKIGVRYVNNVHWTCPSNRPMNGLIFAYEQCYWKSMNSLVVQKFCDRIKLHEWYYLSALLDDARKASKADETMMPAGSWKLMLLLACKHFYLHPLTAPLSNIFNIFNSSIYLFLFVSFHFFAFV